MTKKTLLVSEKRSFMFYEGYHEYKRAMNWTIAQKTSDWSVLVGGQLAAGAI